MTHRPPINECWWMFCRVLSSGPAGLTACLLAKGDKTQTKTEVEHRQKLDCQYIFSCLEIPFTFEKHRYLESRNYCWLELLNARPKTRVCILKTPYLRAKLDLI